MPSKQASCVEVRSLLTLSNGLVPLPPPPLLVTIFVDNERENLCVRKEPA